jgi:DNA-binding MarR family transcriptional regulator
MHMKATVRTKLADEVVQAYLEVGQTLRLARLPNWITADLTLTQLKAMVLLEHYGPQAVGELAGRLGTGKPATSVLVQQLVEQGFAVRSEDTRDRRRTLVRLTPEGAALVSGQRQRTEEQLRGWLIELDDAELADLQAGLAALVRAAQAVPAIQAGQ